MKDPHAKGHLLARLHIGKRHDRQTPSVGTPASPTPSHESVNKGTREREASRDKKEGFAHRPALKIRLVTWNMHDNVPTGDLTDFLGVLPDHAVPLPKAEDETSLPPLPRDAEHLHHLVVVGGQECPGGARWTETLEDYLVRGYTHMPRDTHHSPTAAHHRSSSLSDVADLVDSPLENQAPRVPPPIALAPPLPGMRRQESQSSLIRVESDLTTPLARTRSSQGKEKVNRGPYVLVAKERLMGIYIACFVLRTAEHLVTAHDKSIVTAGLLGGRVGNKGCAAISLHMVGVRMLFVSAHLAAHQTGQNLRKENVLKIRDELHLDDYTGRPKSHGGDPHKKRDVTQDFDVTFFFGDLNYRCDVSRLHADWLVRAQDWKNALEFDQLRPLLGKPGSIWERWREGEIHFAPTFKYDLLKLERKHTLDRKTSSRHLSIDRRKRRAETFSAATSGIGTPASVPIGVEAGLSRSPIVTSMSARSSMSSLQDLLVNSDLPDFSSPATAELAMQALAALRSRSTTSLQVPTRNDSKSSEGEDDPASPTTARPGMQRSATISSQATQVADTDAVYDTSKKQRVQSWCDRILWRSNMAANERAEESADHLSDLRQVSHSSTIKASKGTNENGRRPSATLSTAAENLDGGKPTAAMTLSASEGDDKSGNIPVRPRSRSEASPARQPVKRRSSWALATLSIDKPITGETPIDRRSSVLSWRNWFGLMPGPTSPAAGELETPEPPVPAEPQLVGPKRGEVEVIQYTSVDDLRTMEALSDHRPVKAVLLLGVGDE